MMHYLSAVSMVSKYYFDSQYIDPKIFFKEEDI